MVDIVPMTNFAPSVAPTDSSLLLTRGKFRDSSKPWADSPEWFISREWLDTETSNLCQSSPPSLDILEQIFASSHHSFLPPSDDFFFSHTCINCLNPSFPFPSCLSSAQTRSPPSTTLFTPALCVMSLIHQPDSINRIPIAVCSLIARRCLCLYESITPALTPTAYDRYVNPCVCVCVCEPIFKPAQHSGQIYCSLCLKKRPKHTGAVDTDTHRS